MAASASRRATNCILSSISSITEQSFQGIRFLPKKGESVTYVSGTMWTYVSGRSNVRVAPKALHHI